MLTFKKNYHMKMNRIKNPKFKETNVTKHIQSLGWQLFNEYTHTYQIDDQSTEYSEFTHIFIHIEYPKVTLILYTYELDENQINIIVIYKNNAIIRSNYKELAIQNNLNEVITQKLFEVAL